MFELIKRWGRRLGRGALMRQARQNAESRGGRLVFGWRIRWVRGDHEIWLPTNDLTALIEATRSSDYTLGRLIFRRQGKKWIADARMPGRFLLPSGLVVTLPLWPEDMDLNRGYFFEGGPQTGDWVIDAGACYGETTLEMAARVGPTGRVFAFEPDADCRAYLWRNITESGLKNITVVDRALWGETGTIEFWEEGLPCSSIVGMRIDGRELGRLVKIEALSPADAFALIGRIPDFIKMDIEGAEVEVLEAMAPLLKKAPVRLAVASYHMRDRGQCSRLIEPMLASAGFEVKTGYPEHLTTWAWRKAVP